MGKITKKSENNKQRLSAFFASTKSRPESNKLKVAETTNKLENDKTIATPTKPAKPPTKKRVVVNAKEKKEVKASPVSKKSKSNASRRRKELIDRVRAKGQKTIEEAFQGMASSSAKKQRTMLSRLLDMTDSISFMYTSSNKNVMYLGEVVATLKESSDIPLSQHEIIEYLEHLSKIAPDWCIISNSIDQKKLMKINHLFPVKNVLALIQKKLDEI